MGPNDPRQKNSCTLNHAPQPQTLLRVHLQHKGTLVKKITKNHGPSKGMLCVFEKKNHVFLPKKNIFPQLQLQFSTSTSTPTGEMV